MVFRMLVFAISLSLGLGACSDSPEKANNDVLTKQAARDKVAGGDARDFCAFMHWYGDGVCDSFCTQIDPDCGECSGGDCCTGSQCVCEGDDCPVNGANCPDPNAEVVHYASQDPEECGRIRFGCDETQEYFNNEICGCGCIDSEIPELCPVEGVDVEYVARDTDSCNRIDFLCEEGSESFFIDGCGCGCTIGIGECPSEDQVAYFPGSQTDTTICFEDQYGCEAGQESFFDPACGCGCWNQETECPDPNSPNVGYVSEDPDECNDIDFDCAQGWEGFSNECGCGCVLPRPDFCEHPLLEYVSEDPQECEMVRLDCQEGEPFSNECGCGCIARTNGCGSDMDCPNGYCGAEPIFCDLCLPPVRSVCIPVNCDDGSPTLCDALPPMCPIGQVAAAVNGCFECLDARTCEPPPRP